MRFSEQEEVMPRRDAIHRCRVESAVYSKHFNLKTRDQNASDDDNNNRRWF